MSVPEQTRHEEDAATPPIRRTWRPLVLRLHFYAGVLVAPFIVIAAITGALYAVAPTIERVVYSDLLFVDAHGPTVPLSQQAAAAQAASPGLTMAGMRPAAAPDESTRVTFTDPTLGADTVRAVFVDPHTGRVLGDEPVWFGYLPLSTWLDGFHRHLHLGEPGRIYSEVAASWLWVVALGGVVLWVVKARNERRRGRPGRLLRVDRSVSGRSRTLNWHGATGIWILLMLLFLSATGITWSRFAGETVSDIRSELGWQRPQLNASNGGQASGGIDFEAVIAAAHTAGVHAPLELTMPSGIAHAVSVTEIDKPYRLSTNSAAVDPVTYAVTSVVDYDRDYSLIAKLADWGIRMHMGFLFGWLNQLLLFGVAVGLLLVILRGYRMWWQRRPTRGSDWTLGRPPRRGALRGLHPATVPAIAVIAVAVGWLLPLFGIPLLGFLMADALIASIEARRSAKNT